MKEPVATYVITFESTHAALAATKTLASAGEDFLTIPVPATISAGCGIAIKFERTNPEPILKRIFGANRSGGHGMLYQKVDDANFRLIPLS